MRYIFKVFLILCPKEVKRGEKREYQVIWWHEGYRILKSHFSFCLVSFRLPSYPTQCCNWPPHCPWVFYSSITELTKLNIISCVIGPCAPEITRDLHRRKYVFPQIEYTLNRIQMKVDHIYSYPHLEYCLRQTFCLFSKLMRYHNCVLTTAYNKPVKLGFCFLFFVDTFFLNIFLIHISFCHIYM